MSVCVYAGLSLQHLMMTGIVGFGLLSYSSFSEEEIFVVDFPTANSFYSSVTNSTSIFIIKA